MAVAINEIVEEGFLPDIKDFYETQEDTSVERLTEYLQQRQKLVLIRKLINEQFADLYYEYLEDDARWIMDSEVSLDVYIDDHIILIKYHHSLDDNSNFATLRIYNTTSKDGIIDAINTMDSMLLDLGDSIDFEKVNLVVYF